jgi:hypothetical protein
MKKHMASLYLYGVVNKAINDLKTAGLGGGEVYAVPFRDIAVLVSDTQFIEYDPTEENVVLHEKVIQEVLKHNTAIAPMRFCTIMKTKSDLHKLLDKGYYAFKQNLLKIKNKQEFDVKVFLDVERLKAEKEIEQKAENEEKEEGEEKRKEGQKVEHKEEEKGGKVERKEEYREGKEKYEEEKEDIVSQSRSIAAACYTLLKDIADESTLSDQVTSEMIMNASFLVHESKREAFRNAIISFDKQHTEKLKIRISGPTAPYNFVAMPLK